MTLLELTKEDSTKVIINFDNIIFYKEDFYDNKLFTFIFLKSDINFYVKETVEQIQKMLNEMGHYTKRHYEPRLENLQSADQCCNSDCQAECRKTD